MAAGAERWVHGAAARMKLRIFFCPKLREWCYFLPFEDCAMKSCSDIGRLFDSALRDSRILAAGLQLV